MEASTFNVNTNYNTAQLNGNILNRLDIQIKTNKGVIFNNQNVDVSFIFGLQYKKRSPRDESPTRKDRK